MLYLGKRRNGVGYLMHLHLRMSFFNLRCIMGLWILAVQVQGSLGVIGEGDHKKSMKGWTKD